GRRQGVQVRRREGLGLQARRGVDRRRRTAPAPRAPAPPGDRLRQRVRRHLHPGADLPRDAGRDPPARLRRHSRGDEPQRPPEQRPVMIGLPALRRAVAIAGALAGVLVVSEVTGALAPHGGGGLPVPWPVLVQALAPACITALTAIGLVLIYRATRIINFAHAGFAGVASLLFYELLRFKHFPYLAALVLALL